MKNCRNIPEEAISQPYESNACQYSNTSASLSMAALSYLRQHNEPE
jgi:hypothetical protein